MEYLNIFIIAIGYIAISYFSLKLFFKIESRDFPDISDRMNFSIASCKTLFWPLFIPIELITEVYKIIMVKYSTSIINHFKKDL